MLTRRTVRFAGVQNFATVVVLRFFIGVFEAGFFPGDSPFPCLIDQSGCGLSRNGRVDESRNRVSHHHLVPA